MNGHPEEPRLAVSEIFGPTIQGEGISVGTPAVFLRLAGCNLRCIWCDTPYTWNWEKYDRAKEVTLLPVSEVLRDVIHRTEQIFGGGVLVITGGEPLLQIRNLEGFLVRFQHTAIPGWKIEIETAGTIDPFGFDQWRVHRFNVSPKLAHSGNPKDNRINPEALSGFSELAKSGRASFKFVVQSPEDLGEVDQIVRDYQIEPRNVFIMAEGVNSGDLRQRETDILSEVIRRGYRMSPRLHIDLFGNRRGV